ncbi:GAF domain-containing protein [Streptomyces sp. NPDC059680]|uniref:GAF domain-containing protein n=1 Tax=Streptomyces sp. NPDC059680 TaxID=3346904 RepID=UPI003695679F
MAAENKQVHRKLLRLITQSTRTACEAQACSIQRLDTARQEFIFEAVAGQGEDVLLGRRYSCEQGIAGWSVMSRQPIVVDDVERHNLFARGFAESTGYVPRSVITFPLATDNSSLGVMQVLDCALDPACGLEQLEFIEPFAGQATHVLQLIERDTTLNGVLDDHAGLRELVALATTFTTLSEAKWQAVLQLVTLVSELLIGADEDDT